MGMSKKSEQPKPDQDTRQNPPDGRGPRPTDPNELAKWIVQQTTEESSECDEDKETVES